MTDTFLKRNGSRVVRHLCLLYARILGLKLFKRPSDSSVLNLPTGCTTCNFLALLAEIETTRRLLHWPTSYVVWRKLDQQIHVNS